MTRTFFPGGWYCHAWPTGEYCVLNPTLRVIHTHLGDVPFPAAEPPGSLGVLYLKSRRMGGFRMAGQSHTRGALHYEWGVGMLGDAPSEARWREVPATYSGVYGAIYTHDGDLVINDGSAGSQGYRYIAADGRLVTGDETYFAPWMELSEWSDLGDGLFIGQGHPDWAHDAAWIYDSRTKQTHVLEPGRCTFIHGEVDGDQVALAYVVQGGAVIRQTTHAELRALPLVIAPDAPAPAPVPQPEPEPAPSPIPIPEEPMSKNKDQVRNDINELVRFYNEPDGLNRRARGLPSPVEFHDPAITDWFTLAVMDPIDQVKARIRTFPEYKAQHQSEEPP